MKYARIYADAEGECHFEDGEVDLTPANFAPPALPLDVSPWFSSAKVGFIGARSGYYGAAHPAPQRQIMVVCSGTIDVTTSDGETRRFVPGDIVFVEDTTGKGHTTRVVSEDDLLMTVAQLA